MPAEAQVNPLEMSDEELMKAPEPVLEAPDEQEVPENEDIPEETTEEEEAPSEESDEEEAPSEEDVFEDEPEGTEPEKEKSSKQAKQSKPKEDTETEQSDTTSEDTSKGIDYKAEYERVLAPFRANGKEMKVHSVDDAISLMKMGANYNKKMAGLKPNLKLLKMLENNDLLDEGKLSYLIDLDRKDPAAIGKFIKDSGIDPLDIDTEKGDDYRPNSYTVNDKEVELDEVLDDIRSSPTFKDTIDIISNKWDAPSKQVLLENPRVIALINDHVSNGVYEQIAGIVEHERTLGRLQNMTDIEAYKAVGDILQKQGNLVTQQNPAKKQDTASKSKTDPKLKNRKKAASNTKGGAKKKMNQDFNPLELSDEEFEKIAASEYM